MEKGCINQVLLIYTNRTMGFIEEQSPGADAVRNVKQFLSAKHSRYMSPRVKITLALSISSAEDSQALDLMRTKFRYGG